MKKLSVYPSAFQVTIVIFRIYTKMAIEFSKGLEWHFAKMLGKTLNYTTASHGLQNICQYFVFRIHRSLFYAHVYPNMKHCTTATHFQIEKKILAKKGGT